MGLSPRLKSWWAQSKWLVSVIGAVLVGVVFFFLAPFFRTRSKAPDGTTKDDPLPPLPQAVQDHLNAVHEEATAARVEATVRSEDQRKELAEVRQIGDGKERRKRLAALARRL